MYHYQKVLAIPVKKKHQAVVEHLSPEGIKVLLEQPDKSTSQGRRDLTLISLMYDSGARVQEIIELSVKDFIPGGNPVLILTGKGNKTTGWKGTGSATFHYNTSIFRKMMLDYKRTGRDTYFDIQITNEDPTSSAGRQTIILEDCNIDGGILAKFDADGEYLDEDCDGTFEDFKMPETFKLLDGML